MVCLAVGAPARAANLNVQLFPLTGEVRFRNTTASAVPFALYSITSPSGALNNSSLVWKSIMDNYDLSGNGFIDPTNEWTKISAVSTDLTEGVFTGPGGSLPAFRSISLGNIWNAALYPFPDLAFSIAQPDTSPISITTQFAVAGDYDANGSVNALDYTVWRQSFGSTTSLNADGNLNGVIDAADYAIWRNNFGQSLPGAGSGSSLQVGSAVPEPTSAILLVSALAFPLIGRVRARRVVRPAAGRS